MAFEKGRTVNGRTWFVLGAALAGLGVAAGALGSHLLPKLLEKIFVDEGELRLALTRQVQWEIAVRYQVYHAIALLVIGVFTWERKSMLAQLAGLAMFVGVLLFSGCLYGYVLSGQKGLVHVVPIGGMLQLVGWFLLMAAGYMALPIKDGAKKEEAK